MSTASPDPDKSLKPGEVNPDLIPHDWPLTPLQEESICSWLDKESFHTCRDKERIKVGKATGVGLLCVSSVMNMVLSL